jgi:hypothetical protein
MKNIILINFIILFLINVIKINGDENYLIEEIIIFEQAEDVTGPFGVGINPTVSNEWFTYVKIKQEYNSEIIYNQYFLTDSIIAKIYLYLMLWELQYSDILNIENDLKLYNHIIVDVFPFGCVGEALNVDLAIIEMKNWIGIYRQMQENNYKE